MELRFKIGLVACVALAAAASSTACKDTSEDDGSGAADEAIVSAEDAAPLMPVEAMIERAKHRSYWPDATHDWKAADEAAQKSLIENNAACGDFASFMFPAADADAKTAAQLGKSVGKLTGEEQALRSDGVIVIKGGEIVWEHYVGPYAGHPEKKHCMWSASKSFTTGMLGAIMESSERTKAGERAPAGKLTRSGKTIGLSTPLSDLSDKTAALNPDPRLGKMTVEDLLSMNIPNPTWNEGYDGNIVTSSVVKMLWVDGAKDMGKLAGNSLFAQAGAPGPVTGFKYSSGTAVVLMNALKDLYGAEYDRLPWTVLFDRLGMKSTAFERDQKGVFVGSSYAHMTLRDMARFGYAYLNGGYFGGEQVIHPTFVQKAREIGAGMRAPGTSDEAIEEEGSFYSLGFWINPNPRVLQREGIKRFGAEFPHTAANGLKRGSKFFPNSPVDVFFAAGHYGQNIIVFPQDDLMIVRMSHDNEYFSKLDRMMTKARTCFLSGSRNNPGVK